MSEQRCPRAEQLREAGARLMDDARFDALARHVEDCLDCQRVLREFDGTTDSLVSQLDRPRMANGAPSRDDEPLVDAVLSALARGPRDDARLSADAGRDLYSLGGMLYEMLSGERPFHGNRRLLQVQEDDPRSPRAVNPCVPRDLETISLKAMSKSPARRYQSAVPRPTWPRT